MKNSCPQAKRYMNDYIQYVTSDFLAGLGFGATQKARELEGIYFGYNVDTGAECLPETGISFTRGQGFSYQCFGCSRSLVHSVAEKSFSNNLLVYYAVLFGGQAVIVDPKRRTRWLERKTCQKLRMKSIFST